MNSTNDTFKKLGVLRSALRMVFGSWSWFGHVSHTKLQATDWGFIWTKTVEPIHAQRVETATYEGVGRLSQPCLTTIVTCWALLGFVLLSYFLWESLQKTMVLTCLCSEITRALAY